MQLALRSRIGRAPSTGRVLSLALARWQRCLRTALPLRLMRRVGRPGATLRTRHFCQWKAVRLPTMLPLAFALLLWAPFAVAQSNLGELLDAGGKKLSPEEFKQEVVQRVIVGHTASGDGFVEIMYATNGVVQGLGNQPPFFLSPQPIRGEWTTDDNGRICTSMQIGSAYGNVQLPRRCQFWFKYAEQYFFSDSDSDRHARVLARTVKQ